MDQTRKPHLWCLFRKDIGQMLTGLLFDEARAVVISLNENQQALCLAWREDWPDWRAASEVAGLTEPFARNMMASPPPMPVTDSVSPSLSPVPSESSPSVSRSFSRSMTGSRSRTDGHKLIDFDDVQPNLELSSPRGKIVSPDGELLGSGNSNVITMEAEELEGTSSGNFVIRKSKRYRKSYDITIMKDDNKFETKSLDISVGGVFVENNLPDWIEGFFKVRIKKPNVKQQIELKACLIDGQKPGERFRIGILPLQSENDEKNLESWLAA